MSGATRGVARERQAKRLLESEGWAVTRGAGSHGEADLWAAREQTYRRLASTTELVHTCLRLIQIKTDKRGPFCHFGPKDREALIALGDKTGGTPELWWWPANKPCRIIGEDSWPKVAA